MADLSKVKIGESTYNLKDAQARTDIATAQSGLAQEILDRQAADTQLQTNITAEETRAKGAEGGLDTRIKALESKGRYLSTWDATTGLPQTYPQDSQFVQGKYNYRAGDYYIVNKVAASGSTNYMPDGTYITKEGTTYTVPKKEYTGTLNLGDQFQFDGTSWTHIASATTVAFANIQGDAMENTNLAGKLNAKVDKTQTIAGVDLQDNITKAELQSALDLKALAYKDSASGKISTVDSAKVTVTAAGTVALGEFTQTSTAASLTQADYTPAGTVTGTVVPTGTINVTLKNQATKSEADITYDSYTPAGTIAAVEGGNFSALTAAVFGADSTKGVQISGTVSAPAITITESTENVLGSVKTAQVLPSFTEGAFTAAEIKDGFYTAGSDASLSAGSQAALTAQSKSKFATKVLKPVVDETNEILELSFADSTDSAVSANFSDAVTDRGTFTANTLQTLTGGKATVIDTTKFSGGSKVADTWSAGTAIEFNKADVLKTGTSAALANAPVFTGDRFAVATTADTALKTVAFTGTAADIKAKKVEYYKQDVDTKTFTGNASGDAITASFAGTKVENALVTGVNYDKATANGATFTGTAVENIAVTLSKTDKNVTVE